MSHASVNGGILYASVSRQHSGGASDVIDPGDVPFLSSPFNEQRAGTTTAVQTTWVLRVKEEKVPRSSQGTGSVQGA